MVKMILRRNKSKILYPIVLCIVKLSELCECVAPFALT
jgi:hypothetical protein